MEMHHPPKTENNTIEYIKFAIVILGILVGSWFLAGGGDVLSLQYMMKVMGVFLIVFAFFQLLGYKSFVGMFPDYDPIARFIPGYAYVYPFIGMLLGACYLLNIGGMWRDGVTAIILLIGAIGVYINIRKDGLRPHCACLGNVIKLPLSWLTFFEDVIMGVMALIMLLISL